tara:strand:- start:47 stop:418 length:372 start_codon:yes stop_codon:yes gene_type:complete
MAFKLRSGSISSFKEMGEESPAKHHVDGKPHWKTKVKYRKDGTFKKVVTKSNKGSGNKEHKSLLKGGAYKSVIKFDEDGGIKSAKNNRTKNKHKNKVQRLSRSKWIDRDLTPYIDQSTKKNKR